MKLVFEAMAMANDNESGILILMEEGHKSKKKQGCRSFLSDTRR